LQIHSLETINIEANLSGISKASDWLSSLFERYHVPSKKQAALDHCLDEALMNVLMHGGEDAKDSIITIFFDIKTVADVKEFLLTIVDSGIPFNPIQFIPKPLPQSLEEVVPGGLGVGIIQRMSDRLEYKFEKGQNVLTLSFII
jgi:anti-sigma regulatory factor (Ser/Thr protein kinase)